MSKAIKFIGNLRNNAKWLWGNRPKSKKSAIILLLVLAVIVGGALAFGVRKSPPKRTITVNTVQVEGKQFTFPLDWKMLKISDEDSAQGVKLMLTDSSVSSRFVWRTLEGKVTQPVDFSALKDEVADSILKEVEGIEIVSKDVVKVGEYDSVKLVYKGSSGNADSRVVLYVVPQVEKTAYLTFSAPESSFTDKADEFSAILSYYVTYLK